MGRRNDIDWPAIERDFRIGQFSLRQIAANHGVNPASVSRRATKEAWPQDRSGEVKERTRAALIANATQRSERNSKPDKRPPIDWEKIEAEYRAGIVSLYELAATHAVSRAGIQKRAKAYGWQRNLTERIRQAAVAKAVAGEFTSNDEAATVEAMSDVAANILRRHQKRVGRLQGLIDMIENKLESDDGSPLSALAQAVNNLANARKTAIGLERQACGLSTDPTEGAAADAPRLIEIVIIDP